MLGLQTKKGVPIEFLRLKLCEKFGWTINELNAQPWNEIELFLSMMEIEQQFTEQENRLANKK